MGEASGGSIARGYRRDRYFIAPEITGPDSVFNTNLSLFLVDIGDGRVGRALTANKTLDAIPEDERIGRVCHALNQLIDRTGQEEVDERLTTVRGIYLNEADLQTETPRKPTIAEISRPRPRRAPARRMIDRVNADGGT